MPLPEGAGQPWPPLAWRGIAATWERHDAWYSGDPDKLMRVYGGSQYLSLLANSSPSWWQRAFTRRRKLATSVVPIRGVLHVPLAGDIAATSAALLFGEAPRLYIPEAHMAEAPADAKPTEEYLHKMIVEGDLLNRLVEAAETCAAIGGVFLKPSWDTDIAGVPLLSVIQGDQGLPEFRYGKLWRVTLSRELKIEGQERWRHLEVHETDAAGRGVIYHGLYRGTPGELGRPMELSAHSETAKLEEVVNLPFDGLGIEYVPNMRPNRAMRGSSVGQSDYAGSEGLFDALDEAYASWMRDIRLGKARIMVGQEYLDSLGAFDVDQEVYVPLNIPPSGGDTAPTIEAKQFAIRVDEHERTVSNIIERCVTTAGYAPQTFGLHIEGRAETGVALKVRESKTFLTLRRKGAWWAPSIESALHKMLLIAKDVFNADTSVLYRPQSELADSLPESPMELAQTVATLETARAASNDTKVRMVHPDWTEDQTMMEVERLNKEQGRIVVDPEELAVPPLTRDSTAQMGELIRAGFLPASIVAALAADDMTLLVHSGQPPVTTREAEAVTVEYNEAGQPVKVI